MVQFQNLNDEKEKKNPDWSFFQLSVIQKKVVIGD